MNTDRRAVITRFFFLAIVLFGITKTITACTKTSGKETTATKVSSEYLSWAIKMADSDIKRNPEAWMLDFNEKPRWNYTHGVVCSAIEALWKQTGDEKYFDYLLTYADTMINENGEILTYRQGSYNIDMINTGKFLFSVYKETGEAKYKKALDRLRQQMAEHPRTSEGGFWHKQIYPYQMWLDGLYMGSPFLVQYAKEFNDLSLYDDVAKQIHLITKYTRDSTTGLFYHGWDESREQRWADKETGRSENFWGRGVGWYAMALVDVLDFFPKDHPEYDDILNVIEEMALAVVDYQDKETGLWYQVMDKPEGEGNYLESSASTMLVYFLVKGVSNGYLDKKYLKSALKGYEGILSEFIKIHDSGEVEITTVCAGAGLGGNPYRDGTYEYYINEMVRSNDPKAVGPFIMLCLEMDRYLKNV